MKVNKNIWTGKNKPYNRNSLYFPNGVNLGGDSAGGGDPFAYYKIDGAACSKAFNDVGITDVATKYNTVTNLSSIIDAFIGYVYKGYLGKEGALKGGVSSNAEDWEISQWTGVMYYPLSEDIVGYKETWGIMGVDNSWITPCTKEEFEALITK